ncbi:protein ligase RNF13 [Seminavis robusta]|uniref:RING-type E3 ubiquitin transferase n=1 Tax=Seminavis robusta TaxID=568900 RepID=A0A9N8DZ59_9STRA|nr:protein ligase RNF13 [Seminavis robusta]|eukprot:Sro492_g153890.1 protein ligase RNF13 (534) ;mRNA; r:35445-37046
MMTSPTDLAGWLAETANEEDLVRSDSRGDDESHAIAKKSEYSTRRSKLELISSTASDADDGPSLYPRKTPSRRKKTMRRKRSSTLAKQSRRRRDQDVTETDHLSSGNIYFLANGTNPTSSPTFNSDHITAAAVTDESISLVLDVVYIFLSGLAIIVGLIAVVYALVILCDRYCRCGLRWAEWSDDMFPEEEEGNEGSGTRNDRPSAELYGPVAFKARLWGLSSSERRTVLERTFARYCTKYPAQPRLKAATTLNMKQDASSAATTCVESSSVESNGTCQQPTNSVVDVEGIPEEPTHPACSDVSVKSDDECSTEIPAQIKSKGHNLNFNGESDDTVSELESEEAEADDLNQDADEVGWESLVLNEQRVTKTCAICLGEYEQGDKILHSIGCPHIFHCDCIMPWMEQCHDHCPYCRVEMMTPQDMLRAALQVLPKERVRELTCGKGHRRHRGRSPHPNGTVSQQQNSDNQPVPNPRDGESPQESDGFPASSRDDHAGQADDADDDDSVFSRRAEHHSEHYATSSAGEILNPFNP